MVHKVGVNFCGLPEFYYQYMYFIEICNFMNLILCITTRDQISQLIAHVDLWSRGLKSTKIEPYQWLSKTSNNKYTCRYTSYESLSELVSVLIWPRTETSCIMSLMSRWRLKMSSSLLSGKIQYNTCIMKICSKNVVKI